MNEVHGNSSVETDPIGKFTEAELRRTPTSPNRENQDKEKFTEAELRRRTPSPPNRGNQGRSE